MTKMDRDNISCAAFNPTLDQSIVNNVIWL
jgi:hypothetical protein